MAWSFKVGRVFGIDVKVHLIFVALVAWISIDEAVSTGSILAGFQILSILLLLFGFVLLHELAHSLMALRFGYRVHDITLWPLGGLARIEGGMDSPKSELLIAAAGPATNIVLAGLHGRGHKLFLWRQASRAFSLPAQFVCLGRHLS